jgi:hypothetical protein
MKTGTGKLGLFSQSLTLCIGRPAMAECAPQPETFISTLLFARVAIKERLPSFDVQCSEFDVRCFAAARRKSLVLVVFAVFLSFLEDKKIKIHLTERHRCKCGILDRFRLIAAKSG